MDGQQVQIAAGFVFIVLGVTGLVFGFALLVDAFRSKDRRTLRDWPDGR